jgi:hypothetical protein
MNEEIEERAAPTPESVSAYAREHLGVPCAEIKNRSGDSLLDEITFRG